MKDDEFFGMHLERPPVMAIFRGKSPEETVALCEAAWGFGVGLVEVPARTPEALESLEAAIAAGADRGLPVGAGTVLSVDQFNEVVARGAAFTVAPGFDEDVVTEAQSRGVPHLPGVATSSEVSQAVRLGCRWLKAFPAAELGSTWAAAQHGPFPEVAFVATGGMAAHNAREFLTNGYRAVAVGSAFSTAQGIESLATAIDLKGNA